MDLVLMKFALFKATDDIIERYGFEKEAKDFCRKTLASHAKYREHISPYPDEKRVPDLTLMASFRKSSIGIFKLVEALRYGTEYDGTIKMGIKLRKNAEEILDYGALKEMVKEILDDLAEEAKAVTPEDERPVEQAGTDCKDLVAEARMSAAEMLAATVEQLHNAQQKLYSGAL